MVLAVSVWIREGCAGGRWCVGIQRGSLYDTYIQEPQYIYE